MQKQAIHKLLAIIIGSILIAACGPSSMGYTVPEFESAVEKLYGKSKDDVIKDTLIYSAAIGPKQSLWDNRYGEN